MIEREKFEKVMAMLVQSNIELVKMHFPKISKKEEEYVRFLTEFHLVSGPEIVEYIKDFRLMIKLHTSSIYGSMVIDSSKGEMLW